MEREFKLPIFRHGRKDPAAAIYGKYSEDGAEIAAEEAVVKGAKRLKRNLTILSEKHKEPSDSVLLEAASMSARTIEELMLYCFELGTVAAEARNPITILKLMKKRKDDGEQ